MSKQPKYWNNAKKILSKKDKVMKKLIFNYRDGKLVTRNDIFFSPLATSLPKEIDGAALLYVAILFVRNITDIEWDDIAESGPAVVAMITMPLTYSISNGIALAFISYALVKIFTGKFSSTSPAIWVIAVLSVVSFAVA